MTPERTDLIKKLQALEPSEGEWRESWGYIGTEDIALFDVLDAAEDDITLTTLAPQMRLAILEMAKDIEDKNNKIECLLGYLEKWNANKSNWLAGVPDELDSVIKEAKEYLTPQP